MRPFVSASTAKTCMTGLEMFDGRNVSAPLLSAKERWGSQD